MRKLSQKSMLAILKALPDNVASIKVAADGSFEATLLPRAEADRPAAIPLAPGVLGSAPARPAPPPAPRKPRDIDSLTQSPPDFDEVS